MYILIHVMSGWIVLEICYSKSHGWKFKISKTLNFWNSDLNLAVCPLKIANSSLNGRLSLDRPNINQRTYCNLPNSAFWGSFLWKVGLEIMNSGIILKTFTHEILWNLMVFCRKEVDIIDYVTFRWMTCGFMQLARIFMLKETNSVP